MFSFAFAFIFRYDLMNIKVNIDSNSLCRFEPFFNLTMINIFKTPIEVYICDQKL